MLTEEHSTCSLAWWLTRGSLTKLSLPLSSWMQKVLQQKYKLLWSRVGWIRNLKASLQPLTQKSYSHPAYWAPGTSCQVLEPGKPRGMADSSFAVQTSTSLFSERVYFFFPKTAEAPFLAGFLRDYLISTDSILLTITIRKESKHLVTDGSPCGFLMLSPPKSCQIAPLFESQPARYPFASFLFLFSLFFFFPRMLLILKKQVVLFLFFHLWDFFEDVLLY